MTVSAALKWAWADELPKEPAAGTPPTAARSAWDMIARYAEHMAVIDRQPNRYGCIPFDRADFPHPDAILIAEAVFGLAGLVVDVPDGWHPMPEIADADAALGGAAVRHALARVTVTGVDGQVRFKTSPDALVIRYAIIGKAPDWRLDERPVARMVTNSRGGPAWFVRRKVPQVVGANLDGTDKIAHVEIEGDGWSPRRRMPLPGAYQKRYLDPDPVPAMVCRAEYEIFVAALGVLFDDLACRLDTIRLERDALPLRPWEGDCPLTAIRGRVLPDLRQQAAFAAAEVARRRRPRGRRRDRQKKSSPAT